MSSAKMPFVDLVFLQQHVGAEGRQRVSKRSVHLDFARLWMNICGGQLERVEGQQGTTAKVPAYPDIS